MKIVLDTHILIFAAFGKLERARAALLENRGNELYFSEISAWEIAKLCELGKLKLDDGLGVFLHKLFSHPRYAAVGLRPDVLVELLEVAPTMHRDPADQLIVATALWLEAAIMTNDREIHALKSIECL